MNHEEQIEVRVLTRYLKDQSDPQADRYAFAYTIQISNLGEDTVKLLNRHWVITDDNEKVEEVRGEGVIGQQPEIDPGQTFHYTSGAIIETEFGTMLGGYEMQTSAGEKFIAKIPPFLLSLPHKVH